MNSPEVGQPISLDGRKGKIIGVDYNGGRVAVNFYDGRITYVPVERFIRST